MLLVIRRGYHNHKCGMFENSKSNLFQHPAGAEQQKSGWEEAAEAQMLKPHKC
jgi:hypothetical protein